MMVALLDLGCDLWVAGGGGDPVSEEEAIHHRDSRTSPLREGAQVQRAVTRAYLRGLVGRRAGSGRGARAWGRAI